MFNFCLQLHAKDLAETLNKMYAQKKYKKVRIIDFVLNYNIVILGKGGGYEEGFCLKKYTILVEFTMVLLVTLLHYVSVCCLSVFCIICVC